MSSTSAADGSSSSPDSGPSRGDGTTPPPRRGVPTLTWLLPVATFAIGLLIGFAVWNTGGDNGGTNQAGPTTSAPATTAQTSGSPGATVTVSVPQSCLDAVTESQQSLDLLNQATQAIADLDAARLQTIVDQLQTAAQRIQTLGDDCRASADVVVTPSSVIPTS